jgi:dihydrofolate reductase
MGRLIYSTQVSLDGFIADSSGSFDFTEPDDEVHAFVNDSLRPIGTHLYGRRLYDVMVFWETVPDDSSVPPVMRDFGRVWRGADKVVYSRTLDQVASGRTTLEREFDPDAVRRLKAGSDADLLVGGAELAGAALRAGLVDEVRLFVFPVLVGGGRSAWGEDVRARLELREERRFGGGVVHLRYDVDGQGS